MSGELTRKSEEAGAAEGCMGLLKTLEREEILEVLSDGICQHCFSLLESRIHNLLDKKLGNVSLSNGNTEVSSEYLPLDASGLSPLQNNWESTSKRPHMRESTSEITVQTPESYHSSWRRGYNSSNNSPTSVNSKQHSLKHPDPEILLNDGLSGGSSTVDNGLSEEQKEQKRFLQVGRKKDFVHIERIDGRATNVLLGLELHTKVFNTEEQKKIVECVYNLQLMGQKGLLRERTYSEPRKWMRGKGRVTLQFGCCYNYAVDKNGNPPGIIRSEEVDPLPPMFKQMIKRMVRWHILPPTCIPNSCIVNIYDAGDCIPPHIDHHDFLRPFCTVSFLTESNILFGSNLKIVGPGEFAGPVSIPLPVGSVLILSGNGADVAKHCVPAVSAKRISITFRKMDDSKLPYKFSPEPELLRIKPLVYSPLNKPSIQQDGPQKPPLVYYSPPSKLSFQQHQHQNDRLPSADTEIPNRTNSNSFTAEDNDFPPLHSSKSGNRVRLSRGGSRQ